MQSYESHIPYLLQFSSDYNIQPMGWMHLSTAKVSIWLLLLLSLSLLLLRTLMKPQHFTYLSNVFFYIVSAPFTTGSCLYSAQCTTTNSSENNSRY